MAVLLKFHEDSSFSFTEIKELVDITPHESKLMMLLAQSVAQSRKLGRPMMEAAMLDGTNGFWKALCQAMDDVERDDSVYDYRLSVVREQDGKAHWKDYMVGKHPHILKMIEEA